MGRLEVIDEGVGAHRRPFRCHRRRFDLRQLGQRRCRVQPDRRTRVAERALPTAAVVEASALELARQRGNTSTASANVVDTSSFTIRFSFSTNTHRHTPGPLTTALPSP